MRTVSTHWVFFGAGVALVAALGPACTTAPHNHSQEKTEDAKAEVTAPEDPNEARMKQLITVMSSRLESMENKLSAMNQKLDQAKTALDNVTTQKPTSAAAKSHPSQRSGTAVEARLLDNGFVQDASVMAYRQSMILYQTKKYPEAILSFSAFVEKYPDHPLAGSAQYYLGSCYFKQKEYALATKELQKVVQTYDQSPHVSSALRDLASAQDKLNKPDDAARSRQLLTSLFPSSPAALEVPEEAVATASQGQHPAEAAAAVPSAEPVSPVSVPVSAPASAPGAGNDPVPAAPAAAAGAAAVTAPESPPEEVPVYDGRESIAQ